MFLDIHNPHQEPDNLCNLAVLEQIMYESEDLILGKLYENYYYIIADYESNLHSLYRLHGETGYLEFTFVKEEECHPTIKGFTYGAARRYLPAKNSSVYFLYANPKVHYERISLKRFFRWLCEINQDAFPTDGKVGSATENFFYLYRMDEQTSWKIWFTSGFTLDWQVQPEFKIMFIPDPPICNDELDFELITSG